MLTRSTNLRLTKILGIGILIAIIVGYAIWRSLNYVRGPDITINEPTNGTAVSTSTIAIRGMVLRANNLSLNGKLISIDESGNFDETVIIFPGANILTLKATDQFGRVTEQQLQVYGRIPGRPNAHPPISN